MLFRDSVYSKFKNLVSRKPGNLFCGTTSWIYEGWKNIVYFRPYKSNKEFKENCLVEYFANPLFDFVEIDFTYYAYPRKETLERLAIQVPAHKKIVFKITNSISKPGDEFLNPDSFKNNFVRNIPDQLMDRILWFHLQFSQMKIDRDFLAKKLGIFLRAMNAPISVEFRNAEFQSMFADFSEQDLIPCVNHWTWMRPLDEQFKNLRLRPGEKVYVRLLTPLRVRYEDAVKRFYPYNRIQAKQISAREALASAVSFNQGVSFYVAVNNRFEGCAPLTIADILESFNVS